MQIIEALFKDINQVKNKELLDYYKNNNNLVNYLLNINKVNDSILLNDIKNSLPKTIVKKTLTLIESNQYHDLLIKNCDVQLVIDKEDWELSMKGNYFSVVIPFIEKTVRIPIILLKQESKNMLLEVINDKSLKGNMYIHNLNLYWKLYIEMY